MKITLTGIDDHTNINDIRSLLDRGAELGILYTETPEGRNRYPSPAWIISLLEGFAGRDENFSLHICGHKAREFLHNGDLFRMAPHVKRIQVNGRVLTSEVIDLCGVHREKWIITQNGPYDSGCHNHCILVDRSGGRGILPGEWIRPRTLHNVGFAGGLTPENLAEELPKIREASKGHGPLWVDMESGLRSKDDWFDVDKAHAAMNAFMKFKESR